MSLPSGSTRCHFLSWDQRWLPQVVAWLARDWDGTGPLDLSGVLALVPTRQSGRRLRQALADFADARNSAVFAPQVVTPDALIAPEAGDDIATSLEALLAWTEVFREADLDTLRAVFPIDPPDRKFPWAVRLAQAFTRVQATLTEGGLRLADVAERVGPDFVEADRWQQIADLERAHAAWLAKHGRRDPLSARLSCDKPAVLNRAFTHIVILSVPDAPPLALQRLLALGVPIHVVIFAPGSEAHRFDQWGAPAASRWEHANIDFINVKERVHLCADPAAQASRMARLASRYPTQPRMLALGIADPEVTPLLENALVRAGRPAFNPEGELRRRGGFYELLACLAALAREPSLSAVEALARCPDFLVYLRNLLGEDFSAAGWLAGLDDLRARHLPADLPTALGFAREWESRPDLARGLEAMTALRDVLLAPSFSSGAAEALARIFAGRQLNLSTPKDARLQEDAGAWTGVLRECSQAEQHFTTLDLADWWDLALRIFGDQSHAEDKPAHALDLLGWLELLWEDAPHLAIAGLNDGRVPETVAEDAFLPASLRRRLGLKTNEARFARDAYILQAIVASRQEKGQVDLLVGKTSAAGDPLRPSRLLFRCADAELPERVALLFRSVEVGNASEPWTRAWKLSPRSTVPPERVAVTALRRYLSCPFRFYLKSVLRMQSVEPLKSELDAFDFGTLCHTVLEQVGVEPELRDCTKPEVLRAELSHRLDAAVRRRYGKVLSLPLLVQVESARQRLGKLAELQAAERAAGWQIIRVEFPFELPIAGLLVRGKIDRIDRHDSGAVRVLDYKTSDSPVTPDMAHLRKARDADGTPEWAFVSREIAWSDLQLPLYMRAVGTDYGSPVTCGYFNLPKASGETVLSLWHDYTAELHDSAMRCAEGVCTAIRQGEYWPPNESIRAEWDDCASLFQGGAEASIEWPTR